MRLPLLLASVATTLVQAQTSTPSYTYTAGQPFPSLDPMMQWDKTPDWPKNFGGAPIERGPAPKGCAKFEVLISRGTSEPGPFGSTVGDPVMARVKRDMGPGADVRGYAVQYDATMTSISQGTADIVKRLQEQSKECPDEKFALVGYSQGAMTFHGAISQLAPEIQDKILALVMYGDPAMGALAAFGGSFPGKLNDRLLQNCAGQDFVCMNLFTSGEGHISYNTKGTHWHDQSAKFITAAFQGKPLEGSTGKNWSAAWLGDCCK